MPWFIKIKTRIPFIQNRLKMSVAPILLAKYKLSPCKMFAGCGQVQIHHLCVGSAILFTQLTEFCNCNEMCCWFDRAHGKIPSRRGETMASPWLYLFVGLFAAVAKGTATITPPVDLWNEKGLLLRICWCCLISFSCQVILLLGILSLSRYGHRTQCYYDLVLPFTMLSYISVLSWN